MPFFCYYLFGEDMTIYLDLVFLLNLFFDFLLLLTVNNTLKRNASIIRIFISSLIGSFSIFTLFISFTTLTLFIFKIVLGSFMCIVCFGLKDRKYFIQNLSYFYMTSTVLGGFLYFLNLNFSESQKGLVFSYNGISVNYIFLVISSPIMLYIYFKQQRESKKYGSYYQVIVTFLNGDKQSFSSYLDTGNKLVDPITHKKVILIHKDKLNFINEKKFYVPYNSLNHHGIIECMKISSIEINGRSSKNYLVGISEGDLIRDGIDCVLNAYCLEELL